MCEQLAHIVYATGRQPKVEPTTVRCPTGYAQHATQNAWQHNRPMSCKRHRSIENFERKML